MAFSKQKSVLTIYIAFNLGIIGLMTPMRILGFFSPGEIRNLFLPILLLLFIICIGIYNTIKPRFIIHYVLFLVLTQSIIIGVINSYKLSNIGSHAFQIVSAYIMLNVGYIFAKSDKLDFEFWKINANFVLLCTAISTAIILYFLSSGQVGRLYTPAYNLIFVISVYLLFKNKNVYYTIILLLLSNKRGPILSVFSMMVYYFFNRIKLKFKFGKLNYKKILIMSFISFILLSVYTYMKLFSKDFLADEIGFLSKAYTITVDRIFELVKGGSENLEANSSGRFVEIDGVVSQMQFKDYVFGKGAGFTLQVEEKVVSNIHLTPLSLTAVYGLPFTIYLYVFLLVLFVKSKFVTKKIEYNLSFTEKVAPLYVIGGLVHSFTAYSLFIDLLFFFFIGVMLFTIGKKGAIHGE